MSLNAFVTLLTSDSYLPGALVALQSLLEAEGSKPAIPFETVCLVTPATVSVESIKALRRNFSLVVGVEELRSGSDGNLQLLGRQDLASTLTKLQLFRLIQFRKIIFLDADTLVLAPLSHLFNLEAPFSAAPDAGWPDCFNSGMFVCTPSAETFDGLLEMASERGSWDGGDQGLLNDYFPNWNRLSFTYNVTPSAYYTYAPAYRRHGDDIKVVHFIGQEKPWHQAGNRISQIPSSSSSSSSPSSSSVAKNGKAQHDYASLLDRWFGVYQRYFGTTSTTTFTFPTLQAVWDAPSGSGHSRAAYTPPSLEELKKQFQGVQQAHGIAMGGYKSNLSLTQQAGTRSIEGHYVSMPLSSGRPDLLGARVFVPKVEKPATPENPPIPDEGPSPTIPPTHIVAPTPVKPEVTLHAPSPPPTQTQSSQSPSQEGQRAWSPANISWDPARSEPPKNDRPQMEGGFHYQAENVWDSPRSSTSQRSFFKPPVHYGSIPSITHQNYSQVARSSPDQSKLKPIFPWESTSYSNNGKGSAPAYKPSRVFPPEQQREKMRLTPSRPAPPPPAASTSSSPSSTRSTTPQASSQHQYHYDAQSQQQQQEQHQFHQRAHSGYDNQHRHGHSQASTASPVITDFANLSSAYSNAWDNVEGIRRYAKGLQGGNGNRSSSVSNGQQNRRHGPGVGGNSSRSSSLHQYHSSGSHGTSSSSASSVAGHNHAPSVSSSHSRSASFQAGNSRSAGFGSGNPSSSMMTHSSSNGGGNNGSSSNEYTRQRTNSSNSSGYDTGGEASSRDGDDEDEDEDDDIMDRRAVPIKFRNRASPSSAPSQPPYTTTTSSGNSRFQPASRTSSSETVTMQQQQQQQKASSQNVTPSSSYPGANMGHNTNLPDTSSGTYQPNRVSRVFDPSTATDVIRKEGLEALHRFVRSMEAKGAAVNGKNGH